MTYESNRPPDTLDELVKRIQHDFPGMTAQFQVGARYLIDSPAEIPISSMRKIASQAGVQPATLVRLAQSLGYDGWNSLKDVFAQRMRLAPRRYTEQARKVIRSKNSLDILDKNVAAHIRNINRLTDLNADRLLAAVDLLSRAAHVHIAGFRISFASAFAFQYLYRLFRPSVSILRGDAGTLEMELRSLKKGDALVIISFAPYSKEAIQAAKAARQAGCPVLAICDSIVAPIAQNADCILVFSTETPSFFPPALRRSR